MTETVTRRRFLDRCVRAAAAAAAACGVGAWFFDGRPPPRRAPDPASFEITDFSIGRKPPAIAVVQGEEGYDRVRAFEQALKALGGISAFVKKGDRVLLKVNAAFAVPAALGATSHPDLVSAAARLCFKAGASRVIVADNPINDPASCFALTGIADAARQAGAEVMLPRKDAFRRYTLPGAELIRDWPVFCEPLQTVDKVIGLAPVKDHHRSGASMIMKNWYGLLGGRRNLFHQDIHTIICELARMVSPTLAVLDGSAAMMRNGPTGGSLSDLKPTRTLIVSTDQVAADALGAALLEKPLTRLPFIERAAEAGLGRADVDALQFKKVRI